MKTLAFGSLILGLPALMLADFSYQETTKVTGGAMAGMLKFAGAFSKRANQPVVSSVYVQGNRLARLGQYSGEIIDLDKQTITNINFEKKTYTTMTFAEMRQRMEQAMESAKQKRQEQQQQQPGDAPQMKFKVSAAPTGLSRTFSGYDAKEFLIKVEMDATDAKTGAQGAANVDAHVWLAASIAGYQEVRDFYKRMVAQGGMISNEQAAQVKQSFQGMSELSGQLAKMDGTPVMQVTDIIMSSNQQGAPPDQQQQARQQQQQQNSEDTSGGLAGLAARGIFGGFGHKKKDNADSSASAQTPAPPGTLMETTTEYTAFSSGPVDPSKVQVPEGFRQVTADEVRAGRP